MDPYSWWGKNSPGTAIRKYLMRRGRAEMASRTWVGHLWQGLAAQEEEREEVYPEEHQKGLVLPHLLHSGREHTISLCKGTRSEVEFPVSARIWPGQASALCQWTQKWLGWPEIFSALQALLGPQLDNKRNDLVGSAAGDGVRALALCCLRVLPWDMILQVVVFSWSPPMQLAAHRPWPIRELLSPL